MGFMNALYPWMLAAHNLMRWVVLVLAIFALVRIFWGLFGKRQFAETDRKALSFYTIGMDVQLVLGLLLYFVFSPITTTALGNMGAAMGDSRVRFFAVEHMAMMIIAVVLAHVAAVMARRASTDASKFRRAAVWDTLSVVVLLLAIPWPFFSYGRPLLPHLAALLPLIF